LGNAIFYSDEDTDENEEKCFIVHKVTIRSSAPFSAIDSFFDDLDECQEENDKRFTRRKSDSLPRRVDVPSEF
jgi:hypothetical protein